nr:hypothetical protein [Tanacetum cinerariifolium]
MPPKRRSQTNPQPTLTQKVVDQLVRDGIEAAIKDERERVRMKATRAGGLAGGPTAAPMARECSFTGFMKCGPMQFHGIEGAVGLVRWFEKIENTFEISECAEGNKVKFATATLHGRALTWWNSQVITLGREVANGRPWTEKKVELYIKGLPEIIKGETTSSRPATLNWAVRLTHALMEQKIQANNERIAEGIKRKWENNNQGKHNHNNSHNRDNYRNNNHHNQNNNRRQNVILINALQSENCGRMGHKAKDCRSKNVNSGDTVQSNVVCYKCGERGHKICACPKKADRRGRNVQGQAYVIRDAEHNQGLNVVT